MTSVFEIVVALLSTMVMVASGYFTIRSKNEVQNVVIVRKPDGTEEKLEMPASLEPEDVRSRVREALDFERQVGALLKFIVEPLEIRDDRSPSIRPDFLVRRAGGTVGVEVKVKLSERAALEKYLSSDGAPDRLILVVKEKPSAKAFEKIHRLVRDGRLSVVVPSEGISLEAELRRQLNAA